MPQPDSRLARLRDLVLLFLVGLFGIPGTLVLVARIVSRNTVYTVFAGSSMTFILSTCSAAVVCGVIYVLLPPPSCK
jgi:hypothetical protein